MVLKLREVRIVIHSFVVTHGTFFLVAFTHHRASSEFSQALLALSTSCLELQLMLDTYNDRYLVKDTLQRFAGSLLDHFDSQKERETQEARLQMHWDLTVLYRILHLWGTGPSGNAGRVGQYLSEARRKVGYSDQTTVTAREADDLELDCHRCLH